jgi:hypothetical protein
MCIQSGYLLENSRLFFHHYLNWALSEDTIAHYFATFNYSTEDLGMLLHIHIGVSGLQKAGYVIY